MRTILGSAVVAYVVVMLLVNATFMAFSPKRWFRLPKWIRATGPLTERNNSSGWGGVQVRLTGLLILAGFTWLICNAFIGPIRVPGIHTLRFGFVVTAGVLALVNGLFMVVSPLAWLRLPRWMGEKPSMTEEEYGHGPRAAFIRVSGAILLLVTVWAVHDLMTIR